MADRGALEALVRRAYAPVVLVQSSDGADALLRGDGLTVVDFLRPFAERPVAVPLRTPTRAFTVPDFTVRLLPASELGCASVDGVEAHLARAVGDAPAPAGDAASIATADDAVRFLTRAAAPAPGKAKGELSAAYAAYRAELGRVVRCLPQEQRDAPLALLIVASTADANPIGVFHELASASALPRPFQADMYDADLPRFFLLLHDAAGARAGGGRRLISETAVVGTGRG